MTIAAAYLTSEGVVLGGDSTTTISFPGAGVVQLLNHAQKVYEIGQNSQFGLCTFGAGTVGLLSHRSIAARLGDWVSGRGPTVAEVGAQLVAELTGQIANVTAPFEVGYFLGGVNPGSREPKCLRVAFSFQGADSAGSPLVQSRVDDLATGQAVFDGAPDYFTRVFHGYAQGLPEAIRDELKQVLAQSGALPSNFDNLFTQACQEALPRFASAGFQDLPLREAIDYVHTYLEVTIKAFKFRFGPALCGGPIEIAYISTDRPFRWARHKSFSSAIAEHRGAP